MTRQFDAIVIGSGLGGLTAAALYARAGHRVLVLERNQNFGGAATVYQHGELAIEASLHEIDGLDAEDPEDADPALSRPRPGYSIRRCRRPARGEKPASRRAFCSAARARRGACRYETALSPPVDRAGADISSASGQFATLSR